DLTVPTTCLGNLTLPELTVDINGAGGIATYVWFFGDNTSSSQASPQHLYAAAENYPIELQVTAVNGCSALATADAEVLSPPFAAFAVSNACVNTPFALISTGESGSDPVISWVWEVEAMGTFEGEVSEVTFPSSEFFQVTLTVTSENGCQDEQSLQIPVFELPEPDFSFDPAIGLPPLDVTFVNLTPNAETYLWNFGDAQSSSQFDPVHTYLEEGTLSISLQATNVYGCIGTSEQEISLIEPRLDLSIEQLYLEETPFGIQTTIAVVNFGNYLVDLANVIVQQGNGTPVGEELLLNIMPGASAIYTLTSRVQPTDQTDAYVCAEINAVSSFPVEETPHNNQLCAGLIVPFEVAAVFPNPATSGGTINLRIVTPTSDVVVVSIYDALGKRVLETVSTEIGIGFTNLEIALPDLQAGVYTIEFFGEQNKLVQTLLVD
ncbi:MAG: PKD repeat protein, partial [Flavobacteriales bacterium]